MTANATPHTSAPPRRRRITKAARGIFAAGAIAATGLGFAAAAIADPNSTDTAPYNACLKNATAHGATTVAARFDCCIGVGWNWVGGTYPAGHCESPAFDTSPKPTAPPRSTVILPPGGQTRAGTQ